MLLFLQAFEVFEDGVELFLSVILEIGEGGFVVLGVTGHFGVRGDAGRVFHPTVVVTGAEAPCDLVKVNPFHFESGERFLIAVSVADVAGESAILADELFTDGCFFVINIGGVYLAWCETMLCGESFGEEVSPRVEGGHAHGEPWARARLDAAI